MKNNTSSALIITTYNWPQALELVLISVLNQSVLPNEIIIADDGSKNETKILIDHYKKLFQVPLIHIWHEDNGFRLSEIRNKAIFAAKSDYIIQIDGDTFLHKHFIKNHLNHSEKNHYLSGSRVLLNNKTSVNCINFKNIKLNPFSRGIKNKLNGLYIPFLSSFFLNPTQKTSKAVNQVRGCNMSFWRTDLLKINGYNEDMTGWGREDSEISVRLINNGKIKKRLKFTAIQYHLFHIENTRNELNKNDIILELAIHNHLINCKNGILKQSQAKF